MTVRLIIELQDGKISNLITDTPSVECIVRDKNADAFSLDDPDKDRMIELVRIDIQEVETLWNKTSNVNITPEKE